MTTAEQRIEQRVTIEQIADRVPVIAELVEAHAEAVEACRLASDAFQRSRLDVHANPQDIGAQAAVNDLQRAIDAVRGIAERYG